MIPVDKLLKKIQTSFHPLNTYLTKSKPQYLLPRHQVKLLTYNMCLVPWIADMCFPTPYVKERLMEFIEKHLHDYDIVCFQEVFALWQEHKDVLIMCA
jgi:mRNA deadenylase 3'-5' endonuclease subunit Ccr4